MNQPFVSLAAVSCILLAAPALASNWVTFQNQTSTRLSGPPSTTTNDIEEKDYAWGDVDLDGDIDLVNVHKQRFTTPGKRTAVFYRNENGVLTDRTSTFAQASDVPGDLGFNTPANNRDVLLVDVTGDDLLDVVTCTTISDGDPKHIGHPRIYRNLGFDGGNNWLGFRHEDFRMPRMYSLFQTQGNPAQTVINPRFCSVAAGDVTGDGALDLYYGDYDSTGDNSGVNEPAGIDYNNRLLINDGTGVFTDQTLDRLDTSFGGSDFTGPMAASFFGAASVIHDMNGDGRKDIVKQTALAPPQHIAINYNDANSVLPNGEGFFDAYDIVVPASAAPYFITVADLNNDGLPDLIETDDNTDVYLLNTGNGADNLANFTTLPFPGATNGFGSQNIAADLDNNGFLDVLTADVDVDIDPCPTGRISDISRSNGNPPNVTFVNDLGVGLTNADMDGVFHFAVFDINNDGWLDIVIGKCNSNEIWINIPPASLAFSYPGGQPDLLTPGQPEIVEVEIDGVGAGVLQAGTARLNLSINGGPFNQFPLAPGGGAAGNDLFEATLPAGNCADHYEYFFSATMQGGGVIQNPAPGSEFGVFVANGVATDLNEMEAGVAGWTVANDVGFLDGAWALGNPQGTISGVNLANPEDDHTPGAGVNAWITELTGVLGAQEVDGNATNLTTPAFDLAGADAVVSFFAWQFCSDAAVPAEADFLEVSVSNGGAFVPVMSIAHTSSQWVSQSFTVGDFVTPTATVSVRFSSSDLNANSTTESGVDDFQIDILDCGKAPTCLGDINGDGNVNPADLALLLGSWNTANPAANLNGDGTVNAADLALLLGNWGKCD